MLIHEILHILVLSPNLYAYFNNGMKNSIVEEQVVSNAGSKLVTKFITPKLIAEARSHFNCPDINGVYLENEGGETSAASHFEKVLFGNEIMTGI